MAPSLFNAYKLINDSGTLGSNIVTMSPFFTPKALNPLAHISISFKNFS